MIERIEILPAEFKSFVFDDDEFLRQRQVEDEQSGPAQRALGGVAVAIRSLRRGISGRIEPQIRAGSETWGLPMMSGRK